MYALSITTTRRHNGFLSRLTSDYFLFEDYRTALEAYNSELEKEYDPDREISLVLLPDDLTDTKEPVTLSVVRDGTNQQSDKKEN